MPTFTDSTVSPAAVEEVWKLLYDPARFPEWWAGFETVLPPDELADGNSRFTYYPTGYPDYPMPQLLQSSLNQRQVVVSCLVSDLRFEWRLEAVDEATRISIHVEIPEAEARRLDTQRDLIRISIQRLAELAARTPG